MTSPKWTVEFLATTERVDGVPFVKNQSEVLLRPYKGGRPEQEDWGAFVKVSTEMLNGEIEEVIISIGGDGHGGFNFAPGMVRRITDFCRTYQGNISTVEEVYAFRHALVCDIQKHLFAGTINSDKGGCDKGGTTVWCMVCRPGILAFANCGDHRCAIRKPDGTIITLPSFNWNNGRYDEVTGTWSTCDIDTCICSGCRMRTQLTTKCHLGESTKTSRYELGEGTQPNEERFVVEFPKFNVRMAETCGLKASHNWPIHSEYWKKVQKELATFEYESFIDETCHEWDIVFSSDGPYSHCALANIQQPSIPGEIADLIYLIYDRGEFEFNKFAMYSQNSLTHKYVPKRYNMTVEDLGALSSSKLLDLFMKWYRYAYTAKMIDDPWRDAIYEAAAFVKKNNFTVTEDMTIEQRIQMVQNFCELCISDDNMLICIKHGLRDAVPVVPAVPAVPGVPA